MRSRDGEGDAGVGGAAGGCGAVRDGAARQPRVGVAGHVIHLGDYRRGKRAVWALVGLLHEPAWLQKVYLECTADGVKVVALILQDDVRVRTCFPSSIDHIPVEVRIATPSST